MTDAPTPRRYARLKAIVAVLGAIVSIPFLIAMMFMGASGERR